MIKHKKNYFLVNAIDMGENIKEYLESAKFNYVIVEGGQVLMWGNKFPVIFGSMEDVNAELNYLKDSKNQIIVMSEFDFIIGHCLSAIEDIIINQIKIKGENDGVCHIFFFNGLNNVININGMTDILNGSVGADGLLSLLISDEDDNKQDFISLGDIKDSDVIFNILVQVLA